MVKTDRTLCDPKASTRPPVPSRCGSTQNMAANLKVVVRVRPMNEREKQQNNRIVTEVVDDRMLVFDPKEELRPFFYHGVQQPNKNYLKRANKELKFVFDHVCGPNASNQDIFETATKDIMVSLMEGYNCSVFVYGATGAGKTFTMIGSKEHPGITYLTMEHLFNTIDGFQMEREFEIAVSYIEVYNENVYDLLKPSKTPLQLREDSKYGVVIAGLTLHDIKTARELLDMLEDGNKNRTQHPTDANSESSRSHAVFQVYVKMRDKTSSQCRMVKLSMIDLAGSERGSATGCVGERFKEGANINRSLLSLGNCINKLADGNSYIPYRDSKLTRLLKDSLGGNCKTVMIANVSPSAMSYEDTYNTLKYAARANKIQLTIKKNIVDGGVRVSQYVKINKELEKRNEDLEKKVKELQAQLTLSNVKAARQVELVKESGERQLWMRRIGEAERMHNILQCKLLKMMSQQRVLALRHFLRTRAFANVADLAHRSSSDALEQIIIEEIPRQERAADSYLKQYVKSNNKILNVWTKWEESNKQMQTLFKEAITACPDLKDFVARIQLQIKYNYCEANNNLRQKITSMMRDEIVVSTECMGDSFKLLKKLYLTLKGYDYVTPALTAEYLEVMNKAKSAKVVTWSDETTASDPHFDFVSTLDLVNPISNLDYDMDAVKDEINSSTDIATDSDDLTDIENRDPGLSAHKRKGTPIKLLNNETIIINDSLEALDTTRNLNSAKKVKRNINPVTNIQKLDMIDPNELNSTFVLAGKVDALKLPVQTEIKTEARLEKRGLTDRTNTMLRSYHDIKGISRTAQGRIVKPVAPLRRMGVAAPMPRAAAFGSSLARDGTALQRTVQGGPKKTIVTENSVGFKAVRARERLQTHPYTRPPIANRK